MKKLTNLFIIFSVFFGYSQNYKGEINAVNKTGLRQITITPNIRAVARDDLRFFRIFDSKNNQVPYAFPIIKKQLESYVQFKVISKKSIPDSITSLVIQNETGKKLNQFNLEIENTSLTKSYSVSGSNDAKEWFGLVANETLKDLVALEGTSLTKIIYVPANTYLYLRIDFNDKKSLPINVQSVGIFKTQFLPEKLVELTDFKYKIKQDKLLKVTRIVFSSTTSYQIDAVKFDISTDYFNRNARIIAKRELQTKKRVDFLNETLTTFDLNSKTDKTIYFNTINEKEFTIEIENFDNQPVAIKDIQLFQKPIVIITKLNANEKYQVVVDTTYTKPTYDLAGFVSEINSNLPVATISNFNKEAAGKLDTTEKPFWQTQIFMWICIIAGGAMVGYFAFGLLKDIKDDKIQ